MLRSMFTAISSLNLHQMFMDVVADNLANANTVGFKSNRATFQDQFAQVLWNGSAPVGNIGGINPAQIGLGARLGSISANFAQGSLQSTGRNMDAAIQGNGFFIYNNGTANFYSRDGALDLDSQGYLVNGSTGMRIQGWTATISGSVGTVNPGGPVGAIRLPLGTSMARATTAINLGGNLDITSGSAGPVNVTVGVYDGTGALHSVDLTFTNTGGNSWSWTAGGGGATGSGTVTFDANGQYTGGGGSITIPNTGGGTNAITVDLSNLTQLATPTDVSIVMQDGLAAGNFSGFFISPDSGQVYGVYSNGMQVMIGQLALATFVNPQGLMRLGQNLFQQGVNSGTAAVGAADTSDRGSIAAGFLEASNVDLGQEFTNMILAQRGFQASSRVINTSDEMLQELVNLKR